MTTRLTSSFTGFTFRNSSADMSELRLLPMQMGMIRVCPAIRSRATAARLHQRFCSSMAYSKNNRPSRPSYSLAKTPQLIVPSGGAGAAKGNVCRTASSSRGGAGGGGTELVERPIFDHRVKWTVGTVCGYLLITHFLLQIFRTDGLSMLPSLPSGAFVVVNKVCRPRGLGDTGIKLGSCEMLERGSVVVAKDPARDKGNYVLKRVTGIAGDQIQVRPPDSDMYNKHSIKTRTVVVPEGCVFLEGDNELASFDSRNYGPVHETRIEGVVIMSIWPTFSLSIAPRPESLPRRPSPPAALA